VYWWLNYYLNKIRKIEKEKKRKEKKEYFVHNEVLENLVDMCNYKSFLGYYKCHHFDMDWGYKECSL